MAHAVIAAAGSRGHRVRVCTRQPRSWLRIVSATLPNGNRIEGALDFATSDHRDALRDADMALVCLPHCARWKALMSMSRHLRPGMLVGALPGFGGFTFAARHILPKDTVIFGTQRIPFVARKVKYGSEVEIRGIRRQTFLGASPAGKARAVAHVFEAALGVRTVPVPHLMNIELSPSNSVVNPARMYSLFNSPKRLLSGREEFFLDWDIQSSEILLRIDADLQASRRLLPRDTSFVAPILLQYDACDAAHLTDQFRSLRSLAGRQVPVRGRGQARMDLASAYVTEDLDHGLPVLHEILKKAGAEASSLTSILQWRRGLGPCAPTPAEQDLVSNFKDIEAACQAID